MEKLIISRSESVRLTDIHITTMKHFHGDSVISLETILAFSLEDEL